MVRILAATRPPVKAQNMDRFGALAPDGWPVTLATLVKAYLQPTSQS